MARRPNTRPTLIYWLIDSVSGEPFYCGKTVMTLERRLKCHFEEAKRVARRPVSTRLNLLGEGNVRITLMETVPLDGDWCQREQRWIELLRHSYPNAVNVCKGGSGAPGNIASEATRDRMRLAQIGRTHPPDVCAKISAATQQRMNAPEQRDRISAKLKGRVYSEQTLLKMSEGQKARFARTPHSHSPETRAKMSASAKRRANRATAES